MQAQINNEIYSMYSTIKKENGIIGKEEDSTFMDLGEPK
jgi:hypothetical protein